MRLAILLLLSSFLISCNVDSKDDLKSLKLLGEWEINGISFVIDGKSFQAETRKLYLAEISQLVWNFKENNLLEEVLNSRTISENYDFNPSEGKVTITGYKIYPEIYLLNITDDALEAVSPVVQSLSFDYSHNSSEGNLIQDAVFLLEGQLPEKEIRNSTSLKKIIYFSRVRK